MIDAIWAYLTSSENRDTLSWLGGGIAAVAAGLWTVIRFFVERNAAGSGGTKSQVPSQELLADRGGLAAGRDLNRNSGNTTRISTGISGWQLAAVLAVFGGVGLVVISQVGSRVTAENGSSAVGGDVTNSTIEVGE